jgi:hypothetical protein
MSLFPRGATILHTEKQLAAVALFVLLVATLLLITVTTKSNASKDISESRLLNAKKSCCSDDIDKLHLLAASYYSVKDNYRSSLMLNNKGPGPVEVRPSLFALNGSRIDAQPVIVPGESFQNIDLSEFGAVSGTIFEEGSLQLVHKGPDLVIGAQLYIVDELRGIGFDEKLVEFQGLPSTQLESVWWAPLHSNVDLILSNTSDFTVTAELRGIEELTTITLSAHVLSKQL